MANIGTLITRIETRMALAAGIDVQTIDEPRLLEMLRHKYNTMFDKHWWMDYLTLEQYTLNGTTGLITGTVENKIRRFIDIYGVYLERMNDPLPLLRVGENPLLLGHPAIAPYSDATKMFKVYPVDTTGDVQIWYRTRLSDDAWEEGDDATEVNMDDELLILGTVYDYLSDDGSNPEAAEKYLGLFTDRLKQLEDLSFQQPIAKRGNRSSIPTQWSTSGP